MKEVVKKEIIKWFGCWIYAISYNVWVNPIKCELIPIRVVIGWRICVNYRKLNKATW